MSTSIGSRGGRPTSPLVIDFMVSKITIGAVSLVHPWWGGCLCLLTISLFLDSGDHLGLFHGLACKISSRLWSQCISKSNPKNCWCFAVWREESKLLRSLMRGSGCTVAVAVSSVNSGRILAGFLACKKRHFERCRTGADQALNKLLC